MRIIGKIQPWALICLFALSYTGENMYMAALPAMSSHFDVAGGMMQLSSTMYFLGFACGILCLGRISDLYGRRPIILSGMSLYFVASVCGIFVENVEILILLRFIAAFGASVGSVIGQAMARDSYQGFELSYIYASTSVWLALAPSFGSTIAGYLLEYCGWRYIFFALSFISLALLISYIKYLPETNPYIGKSTNSYLEIFKIVIQDKNVLCYAFIIGAFNGMMFGFCMEAPFIFISNIGMLPSTYGKLAILLGISMALGSGAGRHWVKKGWSSAKVLKIGLMFSILGCSCLVLAVSLAMNLEEGFATAIIFLPMMLHMVGHGLAMPMCLRHALEDYAAVTGTAGSVFGFLYYLLVASMSLAISYLHGRSIQGFSIVFLIVSLGCYWSYYSIHRRAK